MSKSSSFATTAAEYARVSLIDYLVTFGDGLTAELDVANGSLQAFADRFAELPPVYGGDVSSLARWAEALPTRNERVSTLQAELAKVAELAGFGVELHGNRVTFSATADMLVM